jgi:hypothetical protein
VAALQLGSLLLLARVGLLGVGAACAALGAACACACLGWFLAGPLPVTFLRGRVAADWWHNWPFARWSLACFLVGSTTPLVVPWVVALSHGESATGLLSACNTLINAAGMYVTGVANWNGRGPTSPPTSAPWRRRPSPWPAWCRRWACPGPPARCSPAAVPGRRSAPSRSSA